MQGTKAFFGVSVNFDSPQISGIKNREDLKQLGLFNHLPQQQQTYAENEILKLLDIQEEENQEQPPAQTMTPDNTIKNASVAGKVEVEKGAKQPPRPPVEKP